MYLDVARFLDTVQKNKRARTLMFPEVQETIARVQAGMKWVGLDGGAISPSAENCYGYTTTLVLVALNTNGQIVIGIQRCDALRVTRSGYFHIYNEESMNRGTWKRLSGFSVTQWADEFPDSNKVVL